MRTQKEKAWDYALGIIKVDGLEPSQEELNILDMVWSVYGKYDAKYLERLTHAERPWVNARQGLDLKERCNNIISKQEIQDYYSGLREIHGISGEYSLNKYVSNLNV